jgi:hypothetical protein
LKLFFDFLGSFPEKKCVRIDCEPCHLPTNPCGFQNRPFNERPYPLSGKGHQLGVLMFVEIKENAHKKKYDKESGESESDRNDKREY